MSKFAFIIVAIAPLLVCCRQQLQAYTENKTLHTSQTVLLGGLFPISENHDNQCGKLRGTAVEAVEAMVFAIRTINQDSTLLPGVNLTFDIRDTCSIPNKGLESSLSYVQAPMPEASQSAEDLMAVSGIVGAGFFSHVSMAVASLFRLFQIPQISYGSSASELSDRLRFDYFFRTLPSDAFLARAIADVVIHFNWSFVYALHSDDTFGKSGLEVMLNKITRQNGSTKCVAIQIAIPLAPSVEEFDEIVARMNQPWVRNATVALMYGYKSQTTGIMEAIRKLVLREPDTPLQYLTWVGCEALRVEPKYHRFIRGMIRMEYKVNTSYHFQRHFTSLTPDGAPGNPYWRNYWISKFNCSMNGVPRCDSFNQSEYRQKNEISSLIDAVYAFAHAIDGLIRQHCPTNTLCSNITVQRSAGIAVNGTMIRDYLLYNLSFPGLSADMVQFDSDGNDQSAYVIYNLQRMSGDSYGYVDVGTWDPVHLVNFTGAPIEWNNREEIPQSVCSLPCENGLFTEFVRKQDCCWSCQKCLGENTVSTGEVCSVCEEGSWPNSDRSQCIVNSIFYLSWSNPWGIVIVIATCLGLVATVACAVVFAVFYKHTVVKASSRELSTFLLVGIMLCYLLPFFFLARPSLAICTLRRFLVGFSFAVCFSPLLVKTNRIHRIFNRSTEQLKTQPRFISPFSQVLITLLLISFQVLINLLWLSIEHPSIIHTFDRQVTELRCGESSVVSLVVYLGYNLLLLILSTYFAFLARKIPENFNEARYINVTLYTIIIIWLAFIPIFLATANLGALYQTSALVTAIILSASTTFCCLFAPKLIRLVSMLVKGQKDKEKESMPTTSNFTVMSNGGSSTKASEVSVF